MSYKDQSGRIRRSTERDYQNANETARRLLSQATNNRQRRRIRDVYSRYSNALQVVDGRVTTNSVGSVLKGLVGNRLEYRNPSEGVKTASMGNSNS